MNLIILEGETDPQENNKVLNNSDILNPLIPKPLMLKFFYILFTSV